MTIPQPDVPSLRAAGLLWLLAPLWYVLCEAIAASAFPGYDYAHFYISDLGVPESGMFQGRMLDSQLPAVMNAGFIGTGLLFLLGLALWLGALRSRGAGAVVTTALGVVHVVGIVLVGLVPGSPTNADNGLIMFHGIGAVAAIGGGNLCAIASAGPLRFLGARRWVGAVLGALGLLSATLLGLHVLLPDGVWERGAVYSFLLWQLLTGWALLRYRSAPAADARPLPA